MNGRKARPNRSYSTRHIKFKTTIRPFVRPYPAGRPFSLSLSFVSFLLTLVSLLTRPSPPQANVLFYERKYFANFAVDANFNSRASIFADSRRKRILMYRHFIRHRTRAWLPREKSTYRRKTKREFPTNGNEIGLSSHSRSRLRKKKQRYTDLPERKLDSAWDIILMERRDFNYRRACCSALHRFRYIVGNNKKYRRSAVR